MIVSCHTDPADRTTAPAKAYVDIDSVFNITGASLADIREKAEYLSTEEALDNIIPRDLHVDRSRELVQFIHFLGNLGICDLYRPLTEIPN